MSVVEVLVATAITGTVMAGVLSALAPAQRALAAQTDLIEARQRARVVMETLTRELRAADAVTPGEEGGAAAVTIAIGGTRRVYYLGEDAELRRADGESDLPVVDGVRALAFEYWSASTLLDRAGIEADPPRVRRVRVRVDVAGGRVPAAFVFDVAPRMLDRAP
jgi:hypothetical protein